MLLWILDSKIPWGSNDGAIGCMVVVPTYDASAVWQCARISTCTQVHSFDSTFFWTVLYGSVVLWSLNTVASVLGSWKYLPLVTVAVLLASANAMGYTKCRTVCSCAHPARHVHVTTFKGQIVGPKCSWDVSGAPRCMAKGREWNTRITPLR